MKKLLLLIALIPIAILIFSFLKDSAATELKILNTAISLSSNLKVQKDIVFDANKDLKLDIYSKKGWKADTKRPVLVFFYGGGWRWGDKDYFTFVADSFVDKGYLVVIPNYTLYPTAKYPEFVKDGAKAVAWVNQHIAKYGGDTEQLFIAGHSAGAYIAAMVAFNDQYLAAEHQPTSIIKAVAGIAGPYNFTPKEQQYIDIFGEENFNDMRIENHLNGNEPPALLIHSEGDTTVGLFNQQIMAEALTNNADKVETLIYGQKVTHVKILMKLHPWFAKEVNVAEDIDNFFKRMSE
ncbi:alpha/beta hydrolase [Psychromonas sp. 14N.309.X.WAT.B.A12]|uniref:alpha/beta hydrolase n=1 Tax=Psychromonas sp. 14N.309.X.WAT.B.A12 TaxID=2998322 RepID=UPI0025B18509|nr:alpha/beta hydrolase [Psychromonas sp. 14N.309.X.WAT.B.A12]MDN2664213.1 alpha/beta hydrolase [Psychromonas sp. 14N.309.X.WAT.B.A12]